MTDRASGRNDVGVLESASGAADRLAVFVRDSVHDNNDGLICSWGICTIARSTFTGDTVATQTENEITLLAPTGSTVTGSNQGSANVYDTGNATFANISISHSSVGINSATAMVAARTTC